VSPDVVDASRFYRLDRCVGDIADSLKDSTNKCKNSNRTGSNPVLDTKNKCDFGWFPNPLFVYLRSNKEIRNKNKLT